MGSHYMILCNLLSWHISTLHREFTYLFQFHIFILFKKILFIFIERGREREREGNINVWLPLTCPLLGAWPTTQACALTGNQTGDPLICRLALNPLSHTSQHHIFILSMNFFIFKILIFHPINNNINHNFPTERWPLSTYQNIISWNIILQYHF